MVEATTLLSGQRARREDAVEHALAKLLLWSDAQRRDLLDVLGQFAAANLDPRNGLEGMYRRRNREGNVLRAIFRRIHEPLSEGKPIHQALAPYFSPAEILLVQAGENSGRLADGFFRAVFINEAIAELRATLKAALAYPILLLTVLAVLLAAVSWQLMPMLAQLTPVEKWPALSRELYFVAGVVRSHGIALLAALLTSLALALWSMPRWTGPGRALCDRWLPPWTIYRAYQSSVLLIAIAAMTAASQSLEDAVGDMLASAGPWLRRHLHRIRIGLREGWEPPRALDTGLFDRELIGRFDDYQSAGALLGVLARIGERAVRDANCRIAAQAAVLRNLLFFLVGGLLLWTYAGVVFVLIDLSRSVQSMPH